MLPADPSSPGPEDSLPGVPEADPLTLQLVRSARAGARGDFGKLYEHIAPALYTWASLRIRPSLRTAIDPADLVQEVWCRAWRSFGDFEPDRTSFRWWLFRIAKHVLLEAVRRAERGGLATGSTTQLLALGDVPDEATAVSRRVARLEGLELLRVWIEGLDEEDRSLVIHCGLEGLPHAQVAERLDLEREAVSKRWQRLRARLAEMALPRELHAALG
jgi:RNA polymerase sigma factor (sigma-70 family)